MSIDEKGLCVVGMILVGVITLLVWVSIIQSNHREYQMRDCLTSVKRGDKSLVDCSLMQMQWKIDDANDSAAFAIGLAAGGASFRR